MRHRIGVKIGILFLIFFAEISVFTAIFYTVVFRHDRYMDTFQDLIEEKELVERLRLGLAQVVMPVNDLLIIGADSNEKKNFDAMAAQVEELLRILGKRNTAFPSRKGIIDHIQGEYFMAKETSLRIFAMADPVGNPRAGVLMEETDTIMDDAVEDAGEYHRIIDLDIENMNKSWVKQRSVFLAIFWVVLLVFVGMVIWAMIFVRRHISLPLISLKDSALRIAGGDFHLKVEAPSPDEIGELAGAFNTMLEYLNTSYNELEAYREELEAINTHLMGANEELNALKAGLEAQVKARTADLEQANKELERKIDELARYNRLMVDREIKMRELKDHIRGLEERLKG